MNHEEKVDYIIDTLLDTEWWLMRKRTRKWHLIALDDFNKLVPTESAINQLSDELVIRFPGVCGAFFELTIKEIAHNHTEHHFHASMANGFVFNFQKAICNNCLQMIVDQPKRFNYLGIESNTHQPLNPTTFILKKREPINDI
jgi:hypothetical protein